MKEIKFNSMREVWLWLASGRSIKFGGETFISDATGSYGILFNCYVENYLGIIKEPVKMETETIDKLYLELSLYEKLVSLKRILLLTHPELSSEVMGALTVKQWSIFTREFPDEV